MCFLHVPHRRCLCAEAAESLRASSCPHGLRQPAQPWLESALPAPILRPARGTSVACKAKIPSKGTQKLQNIDFLQCMTMPPYVWASENKIFTGPSPGRWLPTGGRAAPASEVHKHGHMTTGHCVETRGNSLQKEPTPCRPMPLLVHSWLLGEGGEAGAEPCGPWSRGCWADCPGRFVPWEFICLFRCCCWLLFSSCYSPDCLYD